MTSKFNIIVEGEADVKFFKDYCLHLFGEKISNDRFVKAEGWNGLIKDDVRQRLMSMTDNGGKNIVIFDADADVEQRRSEIMQYKEEYDLNLAHVKTSVAKRRQPNQIDGAYTIQKE